MEPRILGAIQGSLGTGIELLPKRGEPHLDDLNTAPE